MELGSRFDLDDPLTLYRAYDAGRLTELYDQLAIEAPLWRLPGVDDVYMAVTRDLVEEAIAKPDEISSNMTRMLFRGDDGAPTTQPMFPLDDPGHALATSDPPVHTAHRKLLLPLLARRVMADREQAVREIGVELVEALGGSVVDITTELADPLTMRVICQVLGVPETDSPVLVQAVIAMDRLIAGLATQDEMQAGAESAMTLGLMLNGYLEGTPPKDSLLAGIQAAMADGSFDIAVALNILLQIVTAGTETTATLIGRAARHLASDLVLQQRLRENPAEIPAFLDGVLRDDGPFQFHYRTARAGASLGGISLPAGAVVLLMWAAADRTSRATAAAADVDGPASHLAFGRGIHFCVGAHLARLEARVAFEELLTRRPMFEADPDQLPTDRRSLMMSRPVSTPIRWITTEH